MEVQSAPRARIHPLVAAAAVAVTLASAVAIGVMTGVLPHGTAKPAEPSVVAQAAPTPAVAPAPVVKAAPESVVIAAPEPLPAVKPVARPKPKPVVRPSAPVHEEPVQVAQSAPAAPAPGAVPPDYRPAQVPPPRARAGRQGDLPGLRGGGVDA